MDAARQVTPGQRLVDTAVARIREEGLTVSLDHISLERVIERAGVSRATAYRYWPTKAAFLREVLLTVVRTTRLEGETPEEVAGLLDLVGAARDRLGTDQGRRDVVIEALRRSIDADFTRICASPSWRTYLGLAATVHGLADDGVRTDVVAALTETEERFVRHRAEVYERVARLIGYRLVAPLRAPEGFTLLSSAAGSLMTGMVVTAVTHPTWAGETMELAPFGTSVAAAWTRPAHHLVSLLLAYLEPDPAIVWDDARWASAADVLKEMLDALERQRHST